MREQIQMLASLQNVDREIKEKKGVKEALLMEVQKREDEIQAKKAEIALLRSEHAEKDKLRQTKEQTLQEESKRSMEKRMRMNRIKNIKELQALQREIEQTKQNNMQLEEELIRLLEELEGSSTAAKAKEEELKKLEEEWSAKRAEVDARVAAIDQDLGKASAARSSIAAQLNGDLMVRYELIFSRRGGRAVVPVSGGICQGCYMNIPPQLLNEIIKSDRLILCPSCHRILYYKPTVPSDKQI